jgi:hypothetical protein
MERRCIYFDVKICSAQNPKNGSRKMMEIDDINAKVIEFHQIYFYLER